MVCCWLIGGTNATFACIIYICNTWVSSVIHSTQKCGMCSTNSTPQLKFQIKTQQCIRLQCYCKTAWHNIGWTKHTWNTMNNRSHDSFLRKAKHKTIRIKTEQRQTNWHCSCDIFSLSWMKHTKTFLKPSAKLISTSWIKHTKKNSKCKFKAYPERQKLHVVFFWIKTSY